MLPSVVMATVETFFRYLSSIRFLFVWFGFTSHQQSIGRIATFQLHWRRKTSGARLCIIWKHVCNSCHFGYLSFSSDRTFQHSRFQSDTLGAVMARITTESEKQLIQVSKEQGFRFSSGVRPRDITPGVPAECNSYLVRKCNIKWWSTWHKKLFIILHADDTAIISESAND
jgi:hypothetical protein